ncbi:hypothetical protein PVK06_020603 [Gossypium arboreum]|uniref:Uncharacterized protein n=1 Tax=Gossypium arboreum TaxID=29729 RepID=A0ABR0PMU0_GOSAR|nr:hypothetical protein PVK06_020603 [Gossypium arboreum]
MGWIIAQGFFYSYSGRSLGDCELSGFRDGFIFPQYLLEASFYLPLHRFFCRVLNIYAIAYGQLNGPYWWTLHPPHIDVEALMESTQKATVAVNIQIQVVSCNHKRQRLKEKSSNVGEKSEASLVHHRPSKEPSILERESLVSPSAISIPPTNPEDRNLPPEYKEFAYPSSSSDGIYKPTIVELVNYFSIIVVELEIMSCALQQAYRKDEANQANSKKTIHLGKQPLS